VLSVVLVGSTGSGGFVYWLLNRNSQRVVDKKVEADREDTIAAAAQKWQEIADASTTKAFKVVKEQCDDCLEKLGGMHDIAGNLIDAMEALLAEDSPQSRADARASVRLARRSMTH
jgi:phytoene/squalene synthetase